MFKAISNFIQYWYMRYLMVTELFIVDKWERHMFHIVALVFFLIVAMLNNMVVVGLINMLTSNSINSFVEDPLLNDGIAIDKEL